MKPRITGVNVASKIPSALKKCIMETVKEGDYISVSDFVRDAVKEKLRREGFSWNSNHGVNLIEGQRNENLE